jgi:hypothetical protein
VRLEVGGHGLTICRELSAVSEHTLWAGFTAESGRAVHDLWEEFSVKKAAAYLDSWSLDVPLPLEFEAKVAILRQMRRSRFERLYEAIVTHEQGLVRRLWRDRWYSAAEWTVYRDGNPSLTLPAFDGLPVHLEPTVDVSVDDWFLSDARRVRLILPGGHWIAIRPELTQGEHMAMMLSAPDPKAATPADPATAWPGVRKLDAYITDWSMVYPSGKPVPIGRDSLAQLDASKFKVLYATVTAYETQLTREREARPIGAQ